MSLIKKDSFVLGTVLYKNRPQFLIYGKINMGQKGFSLLEIVVALIIIAIAVTGLANVFVLAKRHILHSRGRATASQVGRWYLEPLQRQVSPINFTNTCLGGNTAACDSTPWVDNTTATNYVPSWTISSITNTSISKVKLNIQWNEQKSE